MREPIGLRYNIVLFLNVLMLIIISYPTFECAHTCPRDQVFSKQNSSCISCVDLCNSYDVIHIIKHGNGCKLSNRCLRRYRHFVVRQCGPRYLFDPNIGICDSCEKACYDYSLYSPEDCIVICNITILSTTILPKHLQTGVIPFSNALGVLDTNSKQTISTNTVLYLILAVGLVTITGTVISVFTILYCKHKMPCQTIKQSSNNMKTSQCNSVYISMSKTGLSGCDVTFPNSASGKSITTYQSPSRATRKETSNSYSFVGKDDSLLKTSPSSFSYHRLPGDRVGKDGSINCSSSPRNTLSSETRSEYDFRSDVNNQTAHVKHEPCPTNNRDFRPQHNDQDSISKLPVDRPDIPSIKGKFTRLAANDWVKKLLSNGRFIRIMYDAMDQENADRLVKEQTGLDSSQFECVYVA